jgi:hypothetical protein
VENRNWIAIADAMPEYGVSRRTLQRYIAKGLLAPFTKRKGSSDRKVYVGREQLAEVLRGFSETLVSDPRKRKALSTPATPFGRPMGPAKKRAKKKKP